VVVVRAVVEWESPILVAVVAVVAIEATRGQIVEVVKEITEAPAAVGLL
jgi:hypothetical protein